MFNRSTLLLAGVLLSLLLLPSRAALAAGGGSADASSATLARPAAPRALDAFFAAAALPASSFGGLVAVQEGPLSVDQLVTDTVPAAADALGTLGFAGAYGQGYRFSNPIAVLTGQPAGAATLIAVFTSADSAAGWMAFESGYADSIGAQLASTDDSAVTITSFSAIPLDLPGDQAAAYDLQGSATLQGIAVPVHLAIGLMQRGPVVSTVLVAATQDQRSTMQSLATALDANIVAALPLLIS